MGETKKATVTRIVTSAFGLPASGLAAIFASKVLDRWGVLDGPANRLGDYLKTTVTGGDLVLETSFILFLALYGILLWWVWKRQSTSGPNDQVIHSAPVSPPIAHAEPIVKEPDQEQVNAAVAARFAGMERRHADLTKKRDDLIGLLSRSEAEWLEFQRLSAGGGYPGAKRSIWSVPAQLFEQSLDQLASFAPPSESLKEPAPHERVDDKDSPEMMPVEERRLEYRRLFRKRRWVMDAAQSVITQTEAELAEIERNLHLAGRPVQLSQNSPASLDRYEDRRNIIFGTRYAAQQFEGADYEFRDYLDLNASYMRAKRHLSADFKRELDEAAAVRVARAKNHDNEVSPLVRRLLDELDRLADHWEII